MLTAYPFYPTQLTTDSLGFDVQGIGGHVDSAILRFVVKSATGVDANAPITLTATGNFGQFDVGPVVATGGIVPGNVVEADVTEAVNDLLDVSSTATFSLDIGVQQGADQIVEIAGFEDYRTVPYISILGDTAAIEASTRATAKTAVAARRVLDAFQDVRNKIETQFYPGILKGPSITEKTKAGNAWDQAALLYDRLNTVDQSMPSQNIDTAIVDGEIHPKVDDLIAWTEARDSKSAREIIRESIDSDLVLTPCVGGEAPCPLPQPMDHAWVSVDIDGSGPLPTWNLDPSFKTRALPDSDSDAIDEVPFVEYDYLKPFGGDPTNGNQPWPDPTTGSHPHENPVDYYERQVNQKYNANHRSVADAYRSGEISPKFYDSAPSEWLGSSSGTTATVTDYTQLAHHSVELKVTYGSAAPYVETIRASDYGDTPIILRNDATGSNYSPYFEEIGGAAGPADNVGAGTITLTATHIAPDGAESESSVSFKKDDIVAFAVDGWTYSPSTVASIRQAANVKASVESPDSTELADATKETLRYTISKYMMDLEEQSGRIAALTGRTPARSILGSGTAIGRVPASQDLAVPYSVVPDQLHIDIQAELNYNRQSSLPPKPNIGSPQSVIDTYNAAVNASNQGNILLLDNASALEHAVVEEVALGDAVSTIDGLRHALKSTDANYDTVLTFERFLIDTDENGDPIYEFRASNYLGYYTPYSTAAAAVNGKLSAHDPDVRADITSDLAQGRKIITTRRETELDQWTGSVYISRPTSSGASKYKIEGPNFSYDGAIVAGVYLGEPATIPDANDSIQQIVSAGDPVNVINGNMFRDEVDFVIPNKGVPLSFARHYDSAAAQNPDGTLNTSHRGLGVGWSFTYSDYLEVTTSNPGGTYEFTWHGAKGERYDIQSSSSGAFTFPPTLHGTWTRGSVTNPQWFEFTATDGLKHRFAKEGPDYYLQSVLDHNDNGVKIVRSGGRISYVHDANDNPVDNQLPTRRITFTYPGNSVHVADFTGRTWRFDLVPHPSGSTYLYDVFLPGNNSSINDIRYVTIADTSVTSRGRIRAIWDLAGAVRTVHHFEYYPDGRTHRVTERLGNSSSPAKSSHHFVYNLHDQETVFFDELGRQTVYRYDDFGRLLETVHPDMSRETMEWVESGTANDAFLLQAQVDTIGQRTSYEYQSNRLGLLETEIRDDDVADGIDQSLRTEYEYATPPVNSPKMRLIDKRIVNAGTSDERVTTYDYDDNGNLIRTTDPNGFAAETEYYPDGLPAKTIGLPTVSDFDDFVSQTTITSSNKHGWFPESGFWVMDFGKLRSLLNGATRVIRDTQRETSRFAVQADFGLHQSNRGGIVTHWQDDENYSEFLIAGTTLYYNSRVNNVLTPTSYSIGSLSSLVGQNVRMRVEVQEDVATIVVNGSPIKTISGLAFAPTGAKSGLTANHTTIHFSKYRVEESPVIEFPTYNDAGQVTSTLIGGATSASEFNTRGYLTEHTTAEGVVTEYTPDLLGRTLETIVNPNDEIKTVFTYFKNGTVSSVTDPEDNQTTFVYDYRNNLTKEEFRGTDGAVDSIRTYEYDAFGNRIAETDEIGRTTRFTHDERDRVVEVTYADGSNSVTHLNSYGQPVLSIDGNGHATSYGYGQFGRLLSTTDPTGISVLNGYDIHGNVTLTALEGSDNTIQNVSLYEFDSLNRAVEDTLYNPFNLVLTANGIQASGGVSSPLSSTTYEYSPDSTLFQTTQIGLLSGDEDRTSTTVRSAINRGIAVTDGEGNTHRSILDADGRITDSIDARGHITNYTYDSAGRLYDTLSPTVERIVATSASTLNTTGSPYRIVTRNFYDKNGNTVKTRTARQSNIGSTSASQETEYFYDDRNRRYLTIDAEGNHWNTVFDVSGQVIKSIDPLTRTIVNSYDRLGRLRVVSSPEEMVTATEFDNVGNVVSTTDQSLRTQTFEYDAANRLIRSVGVDPDGFGSNGPIRAAITDHFYDQYGRNDETTTIYNKGGNQRSVTTEFEFDAAGRVEFERHLPAAGSDAKVTEFVYDSFHNVRDVIDDLDLTIRTTRDKANRPISVKRIARTNQTTESRTFYDEVGNIVESIDAEDLSIKTTYDSLNLPISRKTIDPGSTLDPHTVFAYDEFLNLSEEHVVSSNGWYDSTTYRYDKLNRLEYVTGPQGRAYVWNSAPNENTPYTTKTEYDPVGNVVARKTRTTSTSSKETTYKYDDLNRQKEEITASGTRFTTYDQDGNIRSITDRNNRRREFVYDEMDRVVRELWYEQFTNGLGTQWGLVPNSTITWTYGDLGHLESVENDVVEQSFTVDLRGRVINDSIDFDATGIPTVSFEHGYQTNTTNSTRQYYYEKIGGVSQTLHHTWFDEFGRADRVRSFVQPGVSTLTKNVYFENFNDVDQVRKIRREASGIQNIESILVYDDLNRIETIDHKRSTNGTTINHYEFEYDVENQIDDFTRYNTSGVSVTEAIGYDDDGQLTSNSDSGESYSYDQNGNRTTGYGYNDPDDPNRMTNAGVDTYQYDDEGNVTQRVFGGSSDTFEWDHRNRLVRATISGISTANPYIVDYQYDANDLRVSKTKTDSITGSQTKEFYVYNQGQLELVLNGNGDVIRRYMNGPGVDQVLAEEVYVNGVRTETNWFLTDHQGTVREVVAANGSVQRFEYDSFGNRTSSGADPRIGYTGREFDSDTGMYNYRARWYSPAMGRFISEDPIGLAAGDTNFYRYVGNSPTNYTDPSGMYEIGAALGFQNSVYTESSTVTNSFQDFFNTTGNSALLNAALDQHVSDDQSGVVGNAVYQGLGVAPGSVLDDFGRMARQVALDGNLTESQRIRLLQEIDNPRQIDRIETIGLSGGLASTASRSMNAALLSGDNSWLTNFAISYYAGLIEGYGSQFTSVDPSRMVHYTDGSREFVLSEGQTPEAMLAWATLGGSRLATAGRNAGAVAPNRTASTLDDVVGGINHNADVATELARRAVARGRVSDSAQAFGSRAHQQFERLNNRLNRRLIDEGSDFRVVAEEFRDALGNVVGRRARGSIGPDAIIRNITDSSFVRLFDLKTHGGIERLISAARQNQFLQRFGAFAEEIFRLR